MPWPRWLSATPQAPDPRDCCRPARVSRIAAPDAGGRDGRRRHLDRRFQGHQRRRGRHQHPRRGWAAGPDRRRRRQGPELRGAWPPPSTGRDAAAILLGRDREQIGRELAGACARRGSPIRWPLPWRWRGRLAGRGSTVLLAPPAAAWTCSRTTRTGAECSRGRARRRSLSARIERAASSASGQSRTSTSCWCWHAAPLLGIGLIMVASASMSLGRARLRRTALFLLAAARRRRGRALPAPWSC